MSNKVRVRFAPSPTGELHIGGARTALYCYLFAQQQGGQFILRVEDTDTQRSSEASLKSVLNDLQWLGLCWDEGPVLPSTSTKASSFQAENNLQAGAYGPYLQSQRLHLYQQHAQSLLTAGKAYYCFLTDSEIEQQRQQFKSSGAESFQTEAKGFQVQSPYRDWALAQAEKKIAQGHAAAIRFKKPKVEKEYVLKDIVRGCVKWSSAQVGDFVIMRSTCAHDAAPLGGGMKQYATQGDASPHGRLAEGEGRAQPVYNFACVVDDHLMQISHVFRSEEHLNNTLRQLMLYEAFGWSVPQFAHMSLILDSNRKKLSKRRLPNLSAEDNKISTANNNDHGIDGFIDTTSHPPQVHLAPNLQLVSVRDFRQAGFYAPALLNALALLGWTHESENEFLSLDELIKSFRLEKLHKAPAMLDEAFFIFTNGQHLSHLAQTHPDQLWALLEPVFQKIGFEFPKVSGWNEKALKAMTGRITNVKYQDVFFNFYPLALSFSKRAQNLTRNYVYVDDFLSKAIVDYERDAKQTDDNKIPIEFVTSARFQLEAWGNVLKHGKQVPSDKSEKSDFDNFTREHLRYILSLWQQQLKKYEGEFLTESDFKSIQKNIKQEATSTHQLRGKHLFHAIRSFITGGRAGLALKDLATLIPRAELIRRAEKSF